MASRYWVGGTASWDGTAGTKWSATSGGGGGEAVPTTADDVFVDASSGSGTLTIATGHTNCRSFNSSGFTGTIAGSAAMAVGDGTTGDSNNAWVWGAGITRTYTGVITFQSTSATQQKITSNGKSFGAAITINCSSNGSYVWGDNFSSSTIQVTLTKGSLDTGGYTTTCGAFSSNNSNVRSLTIDSTFTMSAVTAAWNTATTTNLTYDFSGSSIVLNGGSTSQSFSGGGLTFIDVTINLNGSVTCSISGANIFTNLTVNGSASKTSSCQVSSNQTISGTLTLAGNSATNRLLFASSSVTASRTITCNTTVTASNLDLQYIIGAGSASWNLSAISGNSGDRLGNSGITFTTGATQTWSGTSGGNWSVNAWTGRVPLPQDDVVVNAAFSASQTITIDMPVAGQSISFVGVTGSPSVTTSSGCGAIYGNVTLAAGLGTCTGFAMRFVTTTSLTSAGKQVGTLTWDRATASVTLQDAMSTAGNCSVSSGTLSTNGMVADVSGSFSISGSLTLLTTTLTLRGIVTINSATTVSAASGTIHFANGSSDVTFDTGGKSFGAITTAPGTGVLSFNNGGSFTSIAMSSSGAKTVKFTSPYTYTLTGGSSAFLSGTSGNVVTIDSVNGSSAFSLSSANTLSCDYISLKNCTGYGAGIPHYAGANSTDVSGNTNWNFTSPPSFRAAWGRQRSQILCGGLA